MEDQDHVCPLCCEELDISDRQFFPCKCGYQVCMWCWHRIREQETGLCPACRTPYGDDPHAFSAVDVEEVLKANKEKEAAAKRERLRTTASIVEAAGAGVGSGVDSTEVGFRGTGTMELPKDRTQLANMRVIRRNLVYAVGLPPSIATEEILRKPEYFGQYGKISKIVLNRGNTTTPVPTMDPRRASASAYVTFVHKEDTLACILALDGFLIDNRNVRASYGTSKYCSAFIKNVRCNNPECTYLHCMGETEDTFTKQEIQAGYVTSGRDVLARQQQIMAQALAAGQATGSRRRVGGGGPSGTGKSSLTPVFPPPTYDEPPKPSSTGLVPAPMQIGRSATITTSSVFANAMSSTPQPGIARAVSTGGMSPPSAEGLYGGLPIPKQSGSQMLAGIAVAPQRRNLLATPATAPVSAASVVAGMHSLGNAPAEPPAPHTTLTPLTPLKRTMQKAAKAPGAPTLNNFGDTSSMKLSSLRSKPVSNANGNIGIGPISPNPMSKLSGSSNNNEFSVGSIGGLVIGGGSLGGLGNGLNEFHSNDDTFNDNALIGGNLIGGLERQNRTIGLGGDIFNGDVHSSKPIAVSGSNDKWIASSMSDNNNGFGVGGGDIWGGGSGLSGSGALNDNSGFPSVPGIGGGIIGGTPIGGRFGGPIGPGGQSNGSSALASMLGINLPTGSGSLRESSSSIFDTVGSPQAPVGYGNHGFSGYAPGVIGVGSKQNISIQSPIGGNSIGGGVIGSGGGRSFSGGNISFNNAQSGTLGGGVGSNNDIMLLQTLLPGVHITTGGSQQPVTSGFGSVGPGNWGVNNMPSQAVTSGNAVGLNQGGFGQNWGESSGIVQSRVAPGGGIIGQSGNLSQKQNQNIW